MPSPLTCLWLHLESSQGKTIKAIASENTGSHKQIITLQKSGPQEAHVRQMRVLESGGVHCRSTS